MSAARAALFYLAFFLWTVVLGLVALPVTIPSRAIAAKVSRFWSRGVLVLLAATVGLQHRVRGRENLPRGPCIVAAKHQSAFETLAMPSLLEDPAIAVKRSLLRIPVFGWYLARVGMMPVDRGGRARALKRMALAARRAVAQGRPIVVFPEGTRTAPGAPRAYHPGIYALYRELGLPVVPMALNSGLFWPRRSFAKRAGTVTIAFLPAIAPGLARAAFMRELVDRIEAASEALTAEARTHGEEAN